MKLTPEKKYQLILDISHKVRDTLDLDEIMALSGRIAVMYEGQIVGIVPRQTPVQELGLMMTGAKR
jgi:ABC-type uncharacterized transport system ATPase subunit